MTLNRIRLSLIPLARCLDSEKGNDTPAMKRNSGKIVVLGQPVPRYMTHLPGYGVGHGIGPKGTYCGNKACKTHDEKHVKTPQGIQ